MKGGLSEDISHYTGLVYDEVVCGPEEQEFSVQVSMAFRGKRGQFAGVILASCIVIAEAEAEGAFDVFGSAVRRQDWLERVDSIVEASTANVQSGFGVAWQKLRGLLVDEGPDELGVAVASNDIAAVGRLLGPRDVNEVLLSVKEQPESLVRRPWECSLLEVSVGSGSLEMTKYLLEFHSARPTREALKMAISTGSAELIKMMHERLPESGCQGRVDLLEVAAEFHQQEVLDWLNRDATIFVRELLVVFALEYKLADSLELAFPNGFRP
jgi:hypothetical protein